MYVPLIQYDENGTFFPKVIVPSQISKTWDKSNWKTFYKILLKQSRLSKPWKEMPVKLSHMEPRVTYDTMWYPADIGGGNGY